MEIATVIISSQTERSSWAVVQDVKVHCGAVTRYQTGSRQHLERKDTKQV